MFGWLQKKGENSRVYMVTKEVLWELEAMPQVRRAGLLALAQGLRLMAIEPAGIPRYMLSRPLDFTRDDLMRAYNFVEDARNANNMQISQAEKNSKRLGLPLPDFVINHAKATGRALDVWLATLGAGVAPDGRDQARTIWSLLEGSSASLAEAIGQLRTIERNLAEVTGEPPNSMFGDLSDEEWADACRFVPESFQQRL